MKTVVLIKHVPDTEEPRELDLDTQRLVRDDGVLDEIDARALAVALDWSSEGDEVVALTMGPDDAEDSLRKALAAGADSGVHVVDDELEGSDIARTAAVLAAALKDLGADVIVAGDVSSDGVGGVIPAMIAEHLGIAHATFLTQAEIQGGAVVGTRDQDGARAEVSATLPAVISVTEQAAEPRIPNFKGLRTARSKPVDTLELEDLGDLPETRGAWDIATIDDVPPREGGRVVEAEGADAVAEILQFLSSNNLLGR